MLHLIFNFILFSYMEPCLCSELRVLAWVRMGAVCPLGLPCSLHDKGSLKITWEVWRERLPNSRASSVKMKPVSPIWFSGGEKNDKQNNKPNTREGWKVGQQPNTVKYKHSVTYSKNHYNLELRIQNIHIKCSWISFFHISWILGENELYTPHHLTSQ